MLWLVLGAVILFLLLGGMRAFERASVTSIKSLFAWIAALGGLSLALLLILTGRGGIALGALTMFGPLVYQRWQAARGPRIGGSGPQPARPRKTTTTAPPDDSQAAEPSGLAARHARNLRVRRPGATTTGRL